MHAAILSAALVASALPQAPRPPQAPEPPTQPPGKCKQCSIQCDCGCQSGERCRCAPADADGWRWRQDADGCWYQWRYVTPMQAHPLHLSAVAPLSYARAPSFVGGCAGGG